MIYGQWDNGFVVVHQSSLYVTRHEKPTLSVKEVKNEILMNFFRKKYEESNGANRKSI